MKYGDFANAIFFQRWRKSATVSCWVYFLLTAASSGTAQLQQTSPSLHNPVINQNFADPTIIHANGKYYAYATQAVVNGSMCNIQIASSSDLQNWNTEHDALPQKPVWASHTQDFWAPHVLFDTALHKYVLFFSAKSDDTTVDKCIGVAFAANPTGPFIDKGSPLICGRGFVNIDPMAVVDPVTKRKLLYWGSGFEPIKVQEMADDWSEFKPGSNPIALVAPGSEKEYTILLEGAWLDYANGMYYLYYSGDNCCGSEAHYAVMIAKSDNALGPFTRKGEENSNGSSVILQENSKWIAPGHNSVFHNDKGQTWIAYHAISRDPAQADKGQIRALCISPVEYKNGWPVIPHPF